MGEDGRHFHNRPACDALNSGISAQHQLLDPEICTNVARGLLKKCLEHYEGNCPTTSSSRSKNISLGTLYSGALGARVYLRLRMAQHLKSLQEVSDQKLASEKTRIGTQKPNDAEIQSLLEEACKLAEAAVEIELERNKRHSIRVSLLEGPYVGAKALLAVLYHQLGQYARSRVVGGELLDFLREHTRSLAASECEVLYGRSGALQAILFLRQELGEEKFGSEEVKVLAQAIISEGLRTAAKESKSAKGFPLLWEWHGKRYLGAAHGVVGILHTLLCLQSSELEQIAVNGMEGRLLPLIRETIQGLDSQCWPKSGNLRSSMESKSPDRLVQWCHGSPGFVLLLMKAYDVFKENAYLDKAREIGTKVIWPRGLLHKGVGLCHGISGNAYCLFALERPNFTSIRRFEEDRINSTDDVHTLRWMKQAFYFAEFSLENLSSLESVPDRPYSLFEGTGALCLLVMDLRALKNLNNSHKHEDSTFGAIRFPLYEF